MADVPILDRAAAMMIRRKIRGANRLSRVINKLVTNSEITFRTKYGSNFRLQNEYIDNIVISEGYYESEVVESIAEVASQNAVFWDVGANFGLHSITLKKLRPDIRTICFEPSPEQAARILTHAKLNEVDVDLMCCGLGDKAGFFEFHVMPGNSGMSTFTPWHEFTYPRRILARIERGDDLVKNCVVPTPSIMKIDIEGGELQAFNGMKTVLSSVKTLIFEGANPTLVDEFGFQKISTLDRNEKTAHALKNFIAFR